MLNYILRRIGYPTTVAAPARARVSTGVVLVGRRVEPAASAADLEAAFVPAPVRPVGSEAP